MNEVLKFFPVHSSLPMYAQFCGVSFCDGSYHISREKSDVTVIEYVVDGQGYVTADGRDCLVTKDHVYILQKGARHNYYSSSDHPWRKIFINMAGELPVKLLREYHLAGDWLFDGAGLKDLFLRVEQMVTDNQSDDTVCQAQLSAVYLEALSRLSLSRSSISHSADGTALKSYLDGNMDRIVSNAELAKHIYRSPDYCVKLFHREYGITPYDYQLNEKMSIACSLLRGTSMSVADIAAAVGYHDARYFSGLFRRKCGASPRQYRLQDQ